MRTDAEQRRGRQRLHLVFYEPIPLFAEALSRFFATQSDIQAVGTSDFAELAKSLAGATLVMLCFHSWHAQIPTILRQVRAQSSAPLLVFGPEDSMRRLALQVAGGVEAYVGERTTPPAF